MWQLDARQQRPLDYALYSTYWDCARLGLSAGARQILGLQPSEPESSAPDLGGVL